MESVQKNLSLMEMAVLEEKHIFAHEHKDPELFYLLDGAMTGLCGGKEIYLQKGDFIIIQQMERQAFSALKKVLYLQLHMNCGMVRHYVKSGQLCCGCETSRTGNFANQKTRRLLNRLLNFYAADDPQLELLVQASYYELLYHLKENYSVSGNTALCREDERKAQIQKFIEENYADTVKLNDLADYMHLSPVYLSRYFKQLFGCNFLEYLTEYRLIAAKDDILSYTGRNITQIAFDNGFPNLNAFYKAFREHFGSSPTEYRSRQAVSAVNSAEALQRGRESLRLHQKSNAENIRTQEESIRCDVTASGVPYEKAWGKVINVGELSGLLRSDFQKQIMSLSRELGFLGVRLWGLYSDKLRLEKALEQDNASWEYDFSVMDRIFDFLVENGLTPFLDLGAKPIRILKATRQVLVERERKNVFSDMDKYMAFLRRFLEHYCHRYGLSELNSWRFELWFDYEDPSENAVSQYEARFCAICDMIREKLPNARVGGIGDDPKPLEHMPEVLKRLDFLSAYSYPNDELGKGDLPGNRIILRDDYLEHRAGEWREFLRNTPHIKLYITEWNLTVSNRNMMNDSIFKAAYIVKNSIRMIGKSDLMVYWSGLDLMAENPDASLILFGGVGLITRDGFLKPSYYAFSFLHELGEQLLAQNDFCFITKKADDIVILCWNYKRLTPYYYQQNEEALTAEDYPRCAEDLEPRKLRIFLRGLKAGRYQIKSQVVNEKNGNILGIWKEMGYQKELTLNDIKFLRRRCIPLLLTEYCEASEQEILLQPTLEPNEIRLIRISRAE